MWRPDSVANWVTRQLVHAATRRRGGREIVDDASQPLDQRVASEVEEQAHPRVHEAQRGQERLAVDGGEPVDGLALNDHLVLDYQVGAEAVVEHQPVALEANRRLSVDLKPSLLERTEQDGFIDGLEQAGAEIAMDVDRRLDNGFGDVVEFSHGSSRTWSPATAPAAPRGLRASA